MAVDLNKITEELQAAGKRLETTIGQFEGIERLTSMESYVMGHVRCVQAGVQSALDFVAQCKAFKDGTDKRKSGAPRTPPPPKQLPPAT